MTENMTTSPTTPTSAPLLNVTQEEGDGTQKGTTVVFSVAEDTVTEKMIDDDVRTKNKEIDKPDDIKSETYVGFGGVNVKLKLKHLLTRPGAYYALISAIFFSIQGVFTSALARSMSPFQISAMVVPMTILGSSTFLICKRIPFKRKELRLYFWLAASGISLSCLFCFNSFSYKYISLADAITISSVSLIFVGIFSWILIREPLRFFDFVFALIALAGVVFIARPSFIFGSYEDESRKENSIFGILFALGAAVTSAATAVFVRKQSTLGINSFVTSLSNCIHVEVICVVVCTAASQWKLPTKNEWLFSLGAAVSYFIAQISMYLSLTSESATLTIIIGTLSIVLAFVWQFLFFHVTPPITSYVGGVLVMLACIGIVLKKAKIDKRGQLTNEL